MTSISSPPLVTFAVLAYRQERYVRDAVRSALAQTYRPLEILLCDDRSPDGTLDAMREEAGRYSGPHSVEVVHAPRNAGLAGNLNRMWEASKGDYVVVQSGDDISLPERTTELVARFLQDGPRVDLVVSHFTRMDAAGNDTGAIETRVVDLPDTSRPATEWTCCASGAVAAYSRHLHEKYGPLDEDALSEDVVYSFRAWMESGIGVVEKPLLRYRMSPDSLSVSQSHRSDARATREQRWARRRRVAAGRLANAREWLRAWDLGGRFADPRAREGLVRRLRLRELEVAALDAGPLRLCRLAAATVAHGGGFVAGARLLFRYGLKWY